MNRCALHALINLSRTAFLSCCFILPAVAEPVTADQPKALPSSAQEWSQAAINDINISYQIFLENHPGAYDPHNPDFVKNLTDAKNVGLDFAAKATNGAGYVASLEAFTVRIHDGHAGVYGQLPETAQPVDRWPGFIAVWRGRGLYVLASEPGGPKIGAQVLACDGKPINTLIQENVFAFRGRGEEAGHWWVYARNVFADFGNPYVALPQRCQFSLKGKNFEEKLTWKETTEQAKQWRKDSYNGKENPVGLTEPKTKIFWAAMPTFEPDEKQRNAYVAMTKEIADHRQRYLDADAMVIDLRQNQGGSSMWSKQFASALWGANQFNHAYRARAPLNTEIWWRASPDNTAYFAGLIEVFTNQHRNDALNWVKPIVAGMQKALANGDHYFIEKDNDEDADESAANAAESASFTKPVYVIVPGQCASACLDALDTFTLFPNTKLIGAPSAGDSTYMDARQFKLPSGLGVVVIPDKMYVNRYRGNGQIYTPAIEVTDLNWSSANFLAVVEKDLAAKK